jgi:hypothetical protein
LCARAWAAEIINRADIDEVDKMISNFDRTLEEALQSRRDEGKAELVIRLLRKRIKKQDDAVLDAIADDIFEISDISQLKDYLVR